MHSVQVTNTSVDELVDRIRQAIITDTPAQPKPAAGIINILNKRDAARVLGISEKLFDKLHARACIPRTVNAGTAKNGKPICRWAEHHLQIIRPEIQKLRYAQSDEQYNTSRYTIHTLLGL